MMWPRAPPKLKNVSLYRYQITTCICMKLIFSVLESDVHKAENLVMLQLSNDTFSYASELSYASFCGNGNLFTIDLSRLSNVILGGS